MSSEGPITYDSAKKAAVINKDYISEWSSQEQKDFRSEVESWNYLSTALAGNKGAFPPNASTIDPEINSQIDKIMQGVAKELRLAQMKANNIPFSNVSKESLIKQMNQALELILSKPPWEPAQVKLQQTVGVLGLRCDAYIARGQWADAYADAEVLVMFSPQDWKSYFRKGRCLKMIEKYDEAKQNFVTAKNLAKLDSSNLPMIEKTITELERLMK